LRRFGLGLDAATASLTRSAAAATATRSTSVHAFPQGIALLGKFVLQMPLVRAILNRRDISRRHQDAVGDHACAFLRP